MNLLDTNLTDQPSASSTTEAAGSRWSASSPRSLWLTAAAAAEVRSHKLPAGRECITCGRTIADAGWTYACGVCLEEAEGHLAMVHQFEGGTR